MPEPPQEWRESKDTLCPLRRARVIFHARKDFVLGNSTELKEIGIYASIGAKVHGYVVLSKRKTFSYFSKHLFTGVRGLRLFPITNYNPIERLREAKFQDPWWIASVIRRMDVAKEAATRKKPTKSK